MCGGKPSWRRTDPPSWTENLYYPDGQIQDEVYVYGSFLQSRMHAAGVTCGDCHEPHSLNLYGSADRVCASCHLPGTFDTPTHHFHQPGSPGASCVECHMPSRTYMVIDPRRDHSFRIPRPDLSSRLDTPNACTGCHADQSPQWAAAAVVRWYGSERRKEPHFGETIYQGRRGAPQAESALLDLVGNFEMPVIARASALALLSRYNRPGSVPLPDGALEHPDPLIRLATLRALQGAEPAVRLKLAAGLLRDPTRAVRLEAVPVLADVPRERWSQEQGSAFEAALAEYETWQKSQADRPESHFALGTVYQSLGRLREAERAYRMALEAEPRLVAASINLADLLRPLNRDTEAETVLERALSLEPASAEVHYALGLLRVRQGRYGKAMDLLGEAVRLRPDSARYAYVFAVALHSSGTVEPALTVLREAHRRHPADRDLLLALVTMNRDQGALESALVYVRKWLEVAPRDGTALQLRGELQAALKARSMVADEPE